MKKRIIKISAVSVAVIVVAALLALGALFLIMNRNVAQTGNLLGVSWYNETDTEFTITTVEELREFANLSSFYTFEGQTIKLGADLVLNEGNAEDWAENAPQNKWKPITKFAGTFDGQGHTISGVYAKAYETQMALFINPDYRCTIQNLKLVNSYFKTSGFKGTASFVTGGGGKFIGLYSDAIMNHEGENVGGIASSITKQSTFDECWFDGTINTTLRDCGGIVDQILEGRVNMRHCLFSGEINMPYDYAGTRTGGLCGRLDKAGALIIQDCLASGKINAVRPVYTGGILGATYAGTQITIRDTYLSTDTYGTAVGEYGSNGTFTGNALRMQAHRLNGVSAYQWTTLDFENYWSAVEGSTPVLKRFAESELSLDGVAKAYDISWYNSGSYSFEISNVQQLYGMYIVSAYENFSGKTVKLAADIEVNTGNAKDWEKTAPENKWYPIGSFAGIFDGQGHTISGLYSVESNSYQGFIAKATATSFIKNLSIKNSYFCNTNTSLSAVGSVAGETYGKIENIYSDAIVVAHSLQAGGLLGRANDNDSDGKEDKVVISNCWFDGSVTLIGKENAQGAGLVGRYVQGDLDIVHCLNTGTVTAEREEGRVFIGGFIGCGSYGKGTLNITDSMSTGKVTNLGASVDSVGGVIGRFPSTLSKTYFKNTYATTESNITAIGGYVHPEVYGGVIQLEESWFTGDNAYRYTELDFADYWALTKNSTPVLQMFASSDPSTKGITKKVDTSWYSLDGKEFVIKNQAQMLGFSMLGMCYTFKDQTVKLGADIAMDPSLQWISIGTTNKYFSGTFDGLGHTVSGLSQKSDNVRSGMFGVVTYTGVLKNFRLVDSSFEYYSELGNEKEVLVWLGSVCGDFRGTIEGVYSNASVVSNGNRAGGLIGMPNSVLVNKERVTCTIKNCWFDGSLKLVGPYARYGGGIAGQAMQGKIEILHCLNTGTVSNERTTAGQFIGGIIGSDQNAGCNILIKDCLNTGKVTAAKYNQVGAIVGGARLSSATYTLENCYATDDSCVYDNGTIKLANKHEGKLIGYGVAIPKSDLLGTEAYKWTLLDFGSWAARENEIPVPKPFANGMNLTGIDKMIDTSWYSADVKEMTIQTPAQLYGLSVLAGQTSFEGQTIKLGANIDMKDYPNWNSIGSLNMPFKGTLDGQEYEISNLTQTTSQLYVGVVGYIIGGTVKNIKVIDSTFESTSTGNGFIGSIVGGGSGKLLDSYSNSDVISTGVGVGGLVGRSTGMEISGCWYEGAVTVNYKGDFLPMVGGILGTGATKKTTIDNCLYTGEVTLNFTCTNADRAWRGVLTGGIAGADGAVEMAISDTISAGTVNATWKHNDETGSTNPTQLVDVDDIIGQAKSTKTVYSDNVYSTTSGTWYVEDSGKSGAITGNIAEATLLGVDGYRYTDLDFDTYWAARKEKVPGIKKFVSSAMYVGDVITPDTSWYSDDAEELYIKNEAEFYGFTQLVNQGKKTFKNQIVYLMEDITLNEMSAGTLAAWEAGTAVPNNPWTPVGNGSSTWFEGTFDGQMHTISGIYVNASTVRVGLFGGTALGSEVKNFYLTDSYIYTSGGAVDSSGTLYAYLGSVVGECRGTVRTVYSSAILKTSEMRVGGIVGVLNTTDSNKKPEVNNCWFAGKIKLTGDNGTRCGGIAGLGVQRTGYIKNSLFTGEITYEASHDNVYVGGILGGDGWQNTVNIENTISAGKITGPDSITVAAVLGGFRSKSTSNMTNVYATTETFETGGKPVGNTPSGATVGTPTFVSKAKLEGSYGYSNTLLDFENTWCARTGLVPALKSFTKMIDAQTIITDFTGAWRADISWYNDTDTSFYLKDEEDFLGFASLVNNGKTFTSKTVYLSANMDLNPSWKAPTDTTKTATEPDIVWTPIGNAPKSGNEKSFQGTFDGQGHTISGIYLKWNNDYNAGLFGRCNGATIKNFALTNSYIEHYGSAVAWTGSIAGYMNGGTIENVYSNAIIVTGAMQAGGIVGRMENATGTDGYIKGCWFDGELKSTRTTVNDNSLCLGGILGTTGGTSKTITIENCLNTADIITSVADANTTYALGTGGIFGSTHYYSKTSEVKIRNCINVGIITATQKYGIGTIVGRIQNNNKNGTIKYTIDNCYGREDSIASISKDAAQIIGAYANTSSDSTSATSKLVAESALKGAQIYTNTDVTLDYTKWIARKTDVVIPRYFMGIVVPKSDTVEKE